jgi:hypothetical protein
MLTERITGPIPHLPDETKVKFACQRLTPTYRMCIDQDGSVYSVDPVQGIPDADAAVRAARRASRLGNLAQIV